MLEISSRLIREATEQMASLPGIGKKTALRLVLQLLKRTPAEVRAFSDSFTQLREQIKYCRVCYNLGDTDLCEICSNPRRDNGEICVVENIRDVLAIEGTGEFRGRYHVLGGIISPMDGIGPSDLRIEELVARCDNEKPKEIIFALNSSMEGDTTCFYLFKRLQHVQLKISTLARGLSFGDDLEFADEFTLGKSLINRTPFGNK